MCRSREGAWIEIEELYQTSVFVHGRSREGAWIEMLFSADKAFAAVGRSREGAWIEIPLPPFVTLIAKSSLPRGSVD